MSKKNLRSEEEVREAITNSTSIAGALRFLGFKGNEGEMYRYLYRHIKEYNIDTSHFTGQAYLKGKTHNFNKKIPLTEILVENSFFCGSHLRNRLLKEGLLQKCCYECGLTDWLGKPISLHLDHINGVGYDNRIENLRILCPNCHSQTSNFGSKNKAYKNKNYKFKDQMQKREERMSNFCECGTKIDKSSTICKPCFNSNRSTKIEWPSYEILKAMVDDSSYLAVGKQLGVSDNAVRKRLKRHN